MKDYDYILVDKVPYTNENYQMIVQNSDPFHFSKRIQRVLFKLIIYLFQQRVLGIIQLLSEDGLEIIESAKSFYGFAGIRKALLLNDYNTEKAYIHILKDIVSFFLTNTNS
jgi:hypothetical protein